MPYKTIVDKCETYFLYFENCSVRGIRQRENIMCVSLRPYAIDG